MLVIDVFQPSSDAGELDGSLGADLDRQLVGVVREHLARRAPRSLAVLHGNSIVVLAARPPRAERHGQQLASELSAVLETVAGAGRVTIVIGDTCARPDAYGPAFAASRQALDLMLKLGRRGMVIGARELGPYGLLLHASSREDLEAFARDTVAPLLEHDRRHGSDLTGTLRAYLEEDRVQRRVAVRCFIHINTVVYRIKRIEQLLGRSLNDPSTVFDVTLALRILDVLDATPGSTRTG
jgi:DNA-binding PucR family transcriptional regulator